ncbi:MAG TPA: FtsX-like permease family protein [Burkholderiaceae bacterium]|jgi:ABC-type lipoprotein release transport system permease subunit
MQITTFITHARFAARQLRGAPGQAAIVILGLALGLALALLSTAFVLDELRADADLPGADRLVTLEWRVRGPGGIHTDWFSDIPAIALYEGLRVADAPVTAMSRVMQLDLAMRTDNSADGKPRSAKLSTTLADPDIESLFGLHAIAGNLAATLASPEGLALTESSAAKLFGRRDVLGRTLTITIPSFEAGKAPAQVTLTVMAVLAEPSHNGQLHRFEAMAGYVSPRAKEFIAQESGWFVGAGRLFARMKPGVTPQALGDLAQHLLDQQPPPPGLPADFLKGGGKPATLRGMAIREWGLRGAGSADRKLKMGSLLGAAAGVLGLAMINFINLWSVRTLRRQREIGLRKSLGAGAAALALQFFVEALLVSLLSGVIGVLLAWWAMPALGVMLYHGFDHSVLSPGLLAAALLACVLVAAASALPLALIALRVRAAQSLAGRSHSEGRAGRWLRRSLTVLQFAAASLFAAMTIVFFWQNHYTGQIDRGFQVENRLAFDVAFGTHPTRLIGLLERIRRWPEVIAAAASNDVPGRNFATWYSDFIGPRGERVNLRTGMTFTPGLLDLYGVPVIAGRLSATHEAEMVGHGVVLDRSAARALGFASPEAAIGQTLQVSPVYNDGKPVSVAAVIEDVHLEGARTARVPVLMQPVPQLSPGAISVHSRDPALTRKRLNELLAAEFPEEPPQVLTAREQQGQQYENDRRQGGLIAAISTIALLLAAVGIYALAAYTLRLREREIVLRKLHGAPPIAVARLLAREFATVAGLGGLIGLPLAAWLAQAWLAGFVERAPMGPFALLPLLLTVVTLALVTLLAVLRHLRAAFALRPILALRA